MKKKLNKVKRALKEEKGTGSHYDGYTVKDHKRDMKAHKRAQPKKSIYDKSRDIATKKFKKALHGSPSLLEVDGTPEAYEKNVEKATKRLTKKRNKKPGTGPYPKGK